MFRAIFFHFLFILAIQGKPLHTLKRVAESSDYCTQHLVLSGECNELKNYLDLIPTENQVCEHCYCARCHQDTSMYEDIIASSRGDYHYEESKICKCCFDVWEKHPECKYYIDLPGKEIDSIRSNWTCCNNQRIYNYYFESHSKKYFRFFRNYLEYCDSNKACRCFWPEVSNKAAKINNKAYVLFRALFVKTPLKVLLKESEQIAFLNVAKELDLNKHGVTLQFICHSFLFSHYYQICKELDEYCKTKFNVVDYHVIRDALDDILEVLYPLFLDLYETCLKKHPSMEIHCENEFIELLLGSSQINLDLPALLKMKEVNEPTAKIKRLKTVKSKGSKAMFASKKRKKRAKALSDWLASSIYLLQGTNLNESLEYKKAIQVLSLAIEKDASNPEAYLERAYAYFEMEDYDRALEDYRRAKKLKNKGLLTSKSLSHPFLKEKGTGERSKFHIQDKVEFAKGLCVGVSSGMAVGIKEFVPSLLNTISGIGQGLWALAMDPKGVSEEFVSSLCDCLEFIKKSTTQEMLEHVVPELKQLLVEWEVLADYEKGKMSGHIIGKYGLDIFAGGAVLKGLKYYRNVRRANMMLTCEYMESHHLRAEIIQYSTKIREWRHQIQRNGNLKIHPGRQEKHVFGKQNFELGKSVFKHDDPQGLINKFAGKGTKVRGDIPGLPGYQEVVNFGEAIGYYIDKNTGAEITTTWGKIHYAKDGVHIVPTKPRG